MFLQCVLFSILIGLAAVDSYRSFDSCPTPDIDNGKIRTRLKSKLVRFSCLKRYTLVGNSYATCIRGKWDVPMPVCVRSGCVVPAINNGLRVTNYDDAWVMFFCNPGYSLVGSQVIYCTNGKDWNTTVTPKCVATKSTPALSCDFEQEDMCGWRHDETHDFNWMRWSNKTPSTFLYTGPSYDHTFGKLGSGYYMYVESTGKINNAKARLLSPIYDRSIAANGCFSFYFHMYGKEIGGLRVYQKPDSLELYSLVDHLTETAKQKYILFEKWGNIGDAWYGDVSTLTDFSEDFQIVIEGIRGGSSEGDTAIDDVAILQGENCTAAKRDMAVQPSVIFPDSCSGRCLKIISPNHHLQCSCMNTCIDNGDCCNDFFDFCVINADSCSGRCMHTSMSGMECSCFITCLDEGTCCHDFFEVCDLNLDYGLSMYNDTVPQTQKLVATPPYTTSTTTDTSTTSTTTQAEPIRFVTFQKTTTTTTQRPTTSSSTTTTTHRPTTSTTTTRRTTTERRTKSTSTKKPTVIPTSSSTTSTFSPTTTRKSTTPKRSTSTTTSSKVTIFTKTTVKSTSIFPHGISRTMENHNKYHDLVEKAKKEYVETRKIGEEKNKDKKQTSGGKIAFIIIGVAMCSICVVWAGKMARSQRGRATIAQLRGRMSHDPEVRYLTSDVDDDC